MGVIYLIEKGVEVAAKAVEGAAEVAAELGNAVLDAGKDIGKAAGDAVNDGVKATGDIVKGGVKLANDVIESANTSNEYEAHRHEIVTCNDTSNEKYAETIGKDQEYLMRQNRVDKFNDKVLDH
jgi:hypothetical protein